MTNSQGSDDGGLLPCDHATRDRMGMPEQASIDGTSRAGNTTGPRLHGGHLAGRLPFGYLLVFSILPDTSYGVYHESAHHRWYIA